jgi:DNA-binding transcriptional regulator LsrR (DeoR family)
MDELLPMVWKYMQEGLSRDEIAARLAVTPLEAEQMMEECEDADRP